MKTLLSNLNGLLSVIFTAKVLLYKNSIVNHLIEIKYTKYFAVVSIFLNNPGQYLLPLSKQIFKEVLGYEVELELLLIMFTGYFLSVKNAITRNSFIERFRGSNANYYHNPESGLKLI
jgi:hypothetical protein